LYHESKPIGAVPESALLRQLELERSLEAGSHRLFLAEPSGARSIALGRREPQRTTIHRGITHQRKLVR
jgi:hypothetical protein